MTVNTISTATFCKLTGRDLTTYRGYSWEPGDWREITCSDKYSRLCSSSYFHFYTHPLLASFYNCIHADINHPLLWLVEVEWGVIHECDKSGAKRMRLVDQMDLPVITMVQRVAVALLYIKSCYPDRSSTWDSWADAWLSGEDRTREAAAWAAAWAAVAAERAVAAEEAAWAAARAAARAARAATESGSGFSQQGELLRVIESVLQDIRFSK